MSTKKKRTTLKINYNPTWLSLGPWPRPLPMATPPACRLPAAARAPPQDHGLLSQSQDRVQRAWSPNQAKSSRVQLRDSQEKIILFETTYLPVYNFCVM